MRTVTLTLILMSVWGVLVVAFCGCGSPVADADKARAAVYAAELQACVAHAKTLAESRFCRCETAKRYARPCDD